MDPKGGSFRREIYSDYKANRDATPEDLNAQIPLVREAIEAFGIELVEVPNFEADDVIATLVAEAPDDVSVSIISTDKDLMQLVSDRVSLVDSMKDRRYTPGDVEERFGVGPDQMLDLRSLIGDPSDNIPGVKGIGEKGAAKLIGEWGTLEALLDNAGEVKAKRAREALQEQRDQALLSKELSTLRGDVPLPLALEDLAPRAPDVARLRRLYEQLGFTRLLESLPVEGASAGATPDSGASAEGFELALELIDSPEALATLLAALPPEEPIVLALLCGEGSAVEARAVGLGIALGKGGAAYAPILGEGMVAKRGLSPQQLVDGLAGVLAADAPEPRAWAASSAKQVQSVLGELGLALAAPRDDLGIASFLLDPAGSHQPWALSATLLGRQIESWEDVAGRGAKAIAAEAVPVERAAEFVGAQVSALHALIPLLRARLAEDELMALYEEVELPLTRVLSAVERAGVRIDEEKLRELGVEYEGKLEQTEKEIYELAGEKFLVSSPKQLQTILFDKLGLPPLKKTKTGYSTAESVLEQLAAQHPLPGKILDYRKLSKLKSTYIDALPPLVCGRTGRIHPQFNQLGAATGRLSAQHPNVQNIPIRGAEGARIREAFIPAEGRVMLAADYSQVELRILAHYSGDESLIDAFQKAEDVHRRTASDVWGVAQEDVSDDMRARAKAVNFGIVYGSSAFGLANQLGIAAGEAQETIDRYFERYRGVRRFLDETIGTAKESGYVVTMLGRRRYLPDLASRNRVLRQAAERMAVNTVIQGTAADLIKRAMVEVDRVLAESALSATMIMQVHDELVFELADGDVPALQELVREQMEGALTLSVPLVVDFGVGSSWRDAH
jgi:DNA polymerase-1